MPQIIAGQIRAFYLFDVAETIDLRAVPALIGGPAVAARLAPKQTTPAYVQYDNPPVTFDGRSTTSSSITSWRRSTRGCSTRSVHPLFIDVNELTDRTENALTCSSGS